MQALSKKKTGDICTIKWMFGIPDVLDFLRSRKIKEGSTVQVIQRIKGRKIKMSGTLEEEPLILIFQIPTKEFS